MKQDVFQSFFVQLKTVTFCGHHNRHRPRAQQFFGIQITFLGLRRCIFAPLEK